MKSAKINIGDSALASQYNNLRDDAFAAGHLLPHEQTTPDLTLRVESGICFIGTTKVVFAGGNSPSFTAPTTNPRIDLLTIDSAGVLARVVGTEAASPSVPAYPADKIVLCEVFNRVGQTTIRDTDVAGQGFIQRDVRPYLGGTFISAATQISDGIITAAKLVDIYVKTTGNETINGIKTFGSIPILPASDPTTDNQAARKAYVDAKAAAGIADKNHTTVNLTASTVKTTLRTLTLPANTMKANGKIRIVCMWRGVNTGGGAGTQELFVNFGANEITHSRSSTSGSANQFTMVEIVNRNSVSSQKWTHYHLANDGANPSLKTMDQNSSGVNTGAAVTIIISGQLSNSSHNLDLDAVTVEFIASD